MNATLLDVKAHLLRLMACIELSNQSKNMSAWHSRNFMNMQWIFEQLYVCRYFQKYGQTLHIHDFKQFQQCFDRSQKDNNEDRKIMNYNYGIGIHYPCRMPKKDPRFAELIQEIESDKAKYGQEEGFSLTKIK